MWHGHPFACAEKDVPAQAEADNAPFTQAESLKAWVSQGLSELSTSS